ncbi:hypothetical protein [Pseudonocardia charpentierae]|uniref:Uncharacterized protein n=1 Tax=Pseudonocardia charpentierae TaxID=3075545 RepID=A0ABU2NJ27_9PSEU|nr:hypothetical protein [Pseudonocardia sp. DSM 45834]MDT0353973.1 hypothetical protein [Pseudonocardia sp. DSM 45834]
MAWTVVDELRADGAQVNLVTCPELPAQLSATRRCTLVSDFGVFGVTVWVSRVLGTDAEFDITVDRRPSGD